MKWKVAHVGNSNPRGRELVREGKDGKGARKDAQEVNSRRGQVEPLLNVHALAQPHDPVEECCSAATTTCYAPSSG